MRRQMLLLISGAIAVMLLVIGLGACGSATTQSGSTTPTATATAKPSHKNVYAPYLKQYGPDIRNRIATGLHLTADQVKTQLQSGKTMQDIATAQKVSDADFQTLVTKSFTDGLQPAVQSGGLTQMQVDKLVKSMVKNHKQLDNFMGAHPAKKKGDGTPTPVATLTPSA